MGDDGVDSRRIQELEERLKILEQENELLAERGEDILLLGIVAEEINFRMVPGEVVDAALERISLLK